MPRHSGSDETGGPGTRRKAFGAVLILGALGGVLDGVRLWVALGVVVVVFIVLAPFLGDE